MERFLDVVGVNVPIRESGEEDQKVKVLDKVLDEVKPGGRPVVRKSVCIWLLCLVKYAGRCDIVKVSFYKMDLGLDSGKRLMSVLFFLGEPG